ncbi:CPBP family intramembrane glutamic endopeptidase [Arthrobacter woluwensis]|uniref:CPBP family intramembrane glutamic endopeptidase n=1 Tax=Arthrobacter woluwensis TaxID=156980 RepID=UPI001114F003|nr:CPBP family intramembrane glutamic endopeptidase [Arthrobacter woluwensis]
MTRTNRTKYRPYLYRAAYVAAGFTTLVVLFGLAYIFPAIAAALPGVQPQGHESPLGNLLLGTEYAVVGLGAAFVLMMSLPGTAADTMRGMLKTFARRFRLLFLRVVRALGWRSYTLRDLGQMVLPVAGLVVVMLLVNHWLAHLPLGPGWVPADEDPRIVVTDNATVPVKFLYNLLHAPVLEEVMSRGPILFVAYLLGTDFAHRSVRPWVRHVVLWAVIAVSVVTFAGLHAFANGSNVASAGFGAVGLTWLALRYRSLLPAILMHGFYNAFVAFA